jgi:hypothetical protein
MKKHRSSALKVESREAGAPERKQKITQASAMLLALHGGRAAAEQMALLEVRPAALVRTSAALQLLFGRMKALICNE